MSIKLTTAQAAAILKVHPSLVRRWILAGRIQAERITPRLYLIQPQEIERFSRIARTPGRQPKEQ